MLCLKKVPKISEFYITSVLLQQQAGLRVGKSKTTSNKESPLLTHALGKKEVRFLKNNNKFVFCSITKKPILIVKYTQTQIRIIKANSTVLFPTRRVIS